MKKFFLFVSTFTFLFLIFVTRVNAQVPAPYVGCSDQKEDEWHSLRPYQASPCKKPIQMDEQALLCGNDLVVNDTIVIPKDDYQVIECTPECPGPCGPITCKVVADRKFGVSFNAYDSELPIAGNTELVRGDKPLSTGIFDKTAIGNTISDIVEFFLVQPWRLVGDPGWLPKWSPINFDATPGFEERPPPEISDYPDADDYYEAYQEWRGKACFSTNDIPFIGGYLPDVMLCSNILLAHPRKTL